MAYAEVSALPTSTPTCIDLFCGGGGLTLGFCQAGGIPLAAVDNDIDSLNTYRKMFPICQEVFCGDIESWFPSSKLDPVDVIIGGPPCQGFSLARGLRFVDDPRNHLYKQFIRLVALLQPPWIVMENVQGITNIGGGIILQQIYEDFNNIGYWLDHKIINMADYGVPQTRRRAIFVGNRTTNHFIWPLPSHRPPTKKSPTLFDGVTPYTSIGQAIGDLPWPMGQYFAHRANSQMRGPRNRIVEVDPAFTLRVRGDEFAICDEPATGAFVPGILPETEMHYHSANHPYQILMREEAPSWIESYKTFAVIDSPKPLLQGTRRLALREQARLQSFPDWFCFEGRPYSQARQIGNAVPPLFAKQLFEAIFKQLNKSECSQNLVSRKTELVFDYV